MPTTQSSNGLTVLEMTQLIVILEWKRVQLKQVKMIKKSINFKWKQHNKTPDIYPRTIVDPDLEVNKAICVQMLKIPVELTCKEKAIKILNLTSKLAKKPYG